MHTNAVQNEENRSKRRNAVADWHTLEICTNRIGERDPLWNEKVHSSRYCIVGFLKRCCKNLKHGAENKRAKKDGSSQARKRKHVLKGQALKRVWGPPYSASKRARKTSFYSRRIEKIEPY